MMRLNAAKRMSESIWVFPVLQNFAPIYLRFSERARANSASFFFLIVVMFGALPEWECTREWNFSSTFNSAKGTSFAHLYVKNLRFERISRSLITELISSSAPSAHQLRPRIWRLMMMMWRLLCRTFTLEGSSINASMRSGVFIDPLQ